MSAIDELEDMGYTLVESDDPNRQKYDFSISDGEDNVAWIWGDDHDLDYECNHPSDCIEYGDDDERGQCILCGSWCDWGWENEEGSVEDYHWNGRERVPQEWYPRRDIGGLMKEIVDEMKGEK